MTEVQTVPANVNLQRGLTLLEQQRPDLAEPYLRNALADEPESATAKALLACVCIEKEDWEEAEQLACAAVGNDPEDALALGILGTALLMQEKKREAHSLMSEALRLAPEDATFYGLLSSANVRLKRYREAEDLARRGLAINATHPLCRATLVEALQYQNRLDDAAKEAEAMRAAAPEDPAAYIYLGHVRLRQKRHADALEDFREAARLNPGDPEIRRHLVLGLKARYRLYRLVLNFSFWMQRQGRSVGIVLLVVLLMSRGALRTSIDHNDPGVYGIAVAGLLLVSGAFMMWTWVADPVLHSLLRLNPRDRFALAREQRLQSDVFLGLLGGAIVAAILGLVTGLLWLYALAGAMALLIFPTPHAVAEDGRFRRPMLAVCGVVATLFLAAVILLASGYTWPALYVGGPGLLILTVFTWTLGVWSSNRV